MQRISENSGIESANQNIFWAEYYPQAEALIRQRFGRFDLHTMMGAERCRDSIAFGLSMVDRDLSLEETRLESAERAYDLFQWEMDQAKECGWKPGISAVE